MPVLIFLKLCVLSSIFGKELALLGDLSAKNNPELVNLIDKFKVVAFHFAEPFLTDITVRGLEMEGFVPEVIIPPISEALIQTAKSINDHAMETFGIELGKNFDIVHKASIIRKKFLLKNVSDYHIEVKALEDQIFHSLEVNKYHAFPMGWVGHGLLMIVEKTGHDKYKLIITNTGMGIQYHHGRPDSNGVSPFESRVWKVYENIPFSAFEDGDHWFIQALGMMKDPEYMKKSNYEAGPPDKYFYETFLGNLNDYKVDDKIIPDSDDRFIRMQVSGVCAYSSILAGLLYFSVDKKEFLRRRFIYGQVLLSKFLKDYEKNSVFEEILSQAYDPTARYLLKQLASGVAIQTLEFLESQDPVAFEQAALLGINRSDKKTKNSNTSAAIKALQNLNDLHHVKNAVTSAIRIYKFLKDTSIDLKSASVIPNDISKSPIQQIAETKLKMTKFGFSESDLNQLNVDENVWEGEKHPYVAFNLEYPEIMSPKIDTIELVVEKLKMISSKSNSLNYVDNIMSTYMFDFFKASSPYLNNLIKTKASVSQCTMILKANKEITRNFMSESILPMTVEDLAALTQLVLLSWHAALRYDFLQKYPLGIEKFAAPISGNHKLSILKRIDPNGDPENQCEVRMKLLSSIKIPIDSTMEYSYVNFDTCSAYPGWLSTENDFEAWEMYQQANYELDKDAGKKFRLLSPPSVYPDPFRQIVNSENVFQTMDADNLKLLSIFEYMTERQWKPYNNLYKNNPYLGKYLALLGIFTNSGTHPQFYDLIDVAFYYYLGPWNRPIGKLQGKTTFIQVMPQELFFVTEVHTDESTRKLKKKAPRLFETGHFKRKYTPFEIINYENERKLSGINKDFYERLFADVRSSESLSEPQSIVKLYAYLSFIEGAKTCVFFSKSKLVFIIDRLLGFELYYSQDRNLKDRIMKIFNNILTSEMTLLKQNLESLSIKKKENIIYRMIQTTFVYLRYIIRIKSWKFLDQKIAVKIIAEIYEIWNSLGSLRNVHDFNFSEESVARINVLLWFCIDSRKYFKSKAINFDFDSEFVNYLPDLDIKYKKDPNNFVSANLSMHYFIAKAFLKSMSTSTDEFDLANKIVRSFRFPSILKTLEAAKFTADLIKKELLDYFEPESDKNDAFNAIINSDFEIIEIRKKDSESKIPLIILKISTGRIIVNGIPYISKSTVYDNAKFKLFFNEEEQRFGRNGEIRYLGKTVIYGLSNFRGTGKEFMFSTDGNESSMDIYYLYENVWWPWAIPDSDVAVNILKSIKLMNIEGLRIFNRLTNDNKDLDVIFVKDSELEPIYRVLVENIEESKNSSLKMKLPFIKENLVILNDSQKLDFIPTAMKGFSRVEFVNILRTSDSRSVIFFGPYRLGNDKVPLIFEERINAEGKHFFILLNSDSWILDEDQIIGNGITLSGALKIKSLDGASQALLVPSFEWKRSYDDLSYTSSPLIPVEIIKISNNELLPKERFERFALAYKFMVGLNTGMARDLLNPVQSIDQNSKINLVEFKFIQWILALPIQNPEILSLQIMTAAHVLINLAYYPSSVKNISKSTLSSLLSKKVFYYLLCIREISEKFYVHRVFPEIVNEALFKPLFEPKPEILTAVPSNVEEDDFNSVYQKAGSLYSEIIEGSISTLPENLEFGVNSYDEINMNFARELNGNNFLLLISYLDTDDKLKNFYRLHYRRPQLQISKSTNNQPRSSFYYETMILCMMNHAHFRKEVFVLSAYRKHSESLFINTDLFQNFFIFCLTNYANFSNPIKPAGTSSFLTDLSVTRKIFENDLKERTFEENNSNVISSENKAFVPDDFKNIYKTTIDLINKFCNEKSSIKSESSTFFKSEHTKNSFVLRKLSDSIQNFINTKPIDGSLNVDLNIDIKNQGDILEKIKLLKSENEKMGKKLGIDLETLFNDLNSLTNAIGDTSDSKLITELNFYAHLKKKKFFKNLYGCYFSYSVACFREKFPHVTVEVAEQIREKTFIFYSKKVLQDYLLLISKLTSNLIASSKKVSLDELNSFVVEAKKLLNFDERIQLPGILNFEYRSKQFRLREEQLNDLALLQARKEQNNKKGMFESKVIQRMMAAGKTLVLGTLATILKARQENILSILIPPSSLFQSNSASMQSRTYAYFKSRGKILNFERLAVPRNAISASKVIEFLDWFYFNLKSTMKSRDYLIMSPDSLQSFLNSYIEFLDNYSLVKNNLVESYKTILKNMAEIYRIFNEQTSIILDEIDMTMNPKKELNFPTFEREGYNTIAVILSADLLEWAIFNKEVRKTGLNIIRNNQAALTQENFLIVKNLWLDYIESSLDTKESLWNLKLLDPKESKITKENIINFLRSSNPHKDIEWIEGLNSEDSKPKAQALVIIKMQLDNFLQESFRSTVKEHYGTAGSARPTIKFAVPYVAANTPSEASMFADRWETLNKSLLMTVVDNINEKECEYLLFWIKEQINIESMTSGTPESTVTYENFSLLVPNVNPRIIDPEDLTTMEIFRNALNKKTRAAVRLLFSFYLDTIIIKLNFPTEQITSNALHMCSMFSSVQGYSGTIDNINILPSEVVAASHLDHIDNEKNNGGIIRKLLIDSKDDIVSVVSELESARSAKKNVKSLITTLSDDNLKIFSALIDVGAFLKNFKNSKIAETLLVLLMPRIKSVLYYDEASNMLHFVLLVTENHGDGKVKSKLTHGKLTLSDPESISRATGCSLTERFTFYDQRHITGSDILQPPGSIALLTFGSRNLLRDILQGTLRMRQFMTTQKVFFVITPDVQSYFHSVIYPSHSNADEKLKVSDVIALSAFNEDEKQNRENIALAYTKIDVKLRAEILKTLTYEIIKDETNGENPFEVIQNVFKPARSLFIRDFKEYPVNWIREKSIETAENSLKNFVESRKLLLSKNYHLIDGLESLIESCDREKITDPVTDSVLCYTPKNMPKYDISSSLNTEVQLELNTLQIVEVELETVVSDAKTNEEPIHFRRFKLKDCKKVVDSDELKKNIVSLNEIIHHPDQKQNVKEMLKNAFFSEQPHAEMFISRDLINFMDLSNGVCPFSILSPYNREGTHIFIRSGGNAATSFILVSSDVAQEMLIDPVSDCSDAWFLADLSGIVVKSPENVKIGKSVFDILPDIEKHFFDLLVFNGSLLQLTTHPKFKQMFFNEWITRKGKDIQIGLLLLIARMRALQNKIEFIFGPDDALINTIYKVINGDSDSLNQLINETYDSTANLKNNEISNLKDSKVSHAHGIYEKVSLKFFKDEFIADADIQISSSDLSLDDDDDDDFSADGEKLINSNKIIKNFDFLSSVNSISKDGSIVVSPDIVEVEDEPSIPSTVKPSEISEERENIFDYLLILAINISILGIVFGTIYYLHKKKRSDENPEVFNDQNSYQNDSKINTSEQGNPYEMKNSFNSNSNYYDQEQSNYYDQEKSNYYDQDQNSGNI